MLMQKESFTDRQRRWMRERKEARQKAKPKRDADAKRAAHALDEAESRCVRDELKAVDAHVAVLGRLVERQAARPVQFGSAIDERTREAGRELSRLKLLRAEIEANDLPGCLPDGTPLTDKQRAFRLQRSRELKEQLWAAAEKADSVGDHRRASRCRLDALRARHLAEHEQGVRKSLRGYSHAG